MVFSASYVGLAVIATVVGTVLPWQSVSGVNSFISLMMLVVPAWVAARRFLRVEGRAPSTGEAAKLAVASFLIALIADLLVISFMLRLDGMSFADQAAGAQKSLASAIASADFRLLAAIMLGFAAFKLLAVAFIYRTIDARRTASLSGG